MIQIINLGVMDQFFLWVIATAGQNSSFLVQVNSIDNVSHLFVILLINIRVCLEERFFNFLFSFLFWKIQGVPSLLPSDCWR